MKSYSGAHWQGLLSGPTLQTHVHVLQHHVVGAVTVRAGRRGFIGNSSLLSMAAAHLESKAENFQVPRFPWGDTPEEEHYRSQGVCNHREFFMSARGSRLFTQLWTPLEGAPRALVCMVHGYGNDSSWTFQNTAMLFVRLGYAAAALDLEGHGESEGLRAFTPDLEAVAADCVEFFRSVKESEQFRGLPRFLYGESLGGAVCLLIHFTEPHGWDGAMLVAAMCKISENMKPPWPITPVLTAIAKFVPTWAVVPTADLVEKSVKDPRKKLLARCNPRRYAGKPRLGTVVELLRVTAYLGNRLKDVSLPILVIHGDADVVTDPAVSKALYAAAQSKDKTLKLYNGMLHSLLQGETDENVAIIVKDIEEWLGQRVERSNAQQEKQLV